MDTEQVLDELARSSKGRLRYGQEGVEPGQGQSSLVLQLSSHLVKFLEKTTGNVEVISTPRIDPSPRPESITPRAQRLVEPRRKESARLSANLGTTSRKQYQAISQTLELSQRAQQDNIRFSTNQSSEETRKNQQQLMKEHDMRVEKRFQEAERLEKEKSAAERVALLRELAKAIHLEELTLSVLPDSTITEEKAFFALLQHIKALITSTQGNADEGGPPTAELLLAIQFHLLDLRNLAVAARQARDLHEQQLAHAKLLQEEKEAASNRALEQQKKRQQEEEQKKREQEEEQKKQARELAQGAVTVLDAWCQKLEQDMLDTERACTTLSSRQEPQVKKIRSDINRAVAIPINQISSNAGSHLRDILSRLLALLSGKTITSGGHMVSVSLHPQGLSFAQMKLAEKFVCQGEEEVASHHEAAFPLAAVACGVWEEYPTFGQLLLAALNRRCPYVVPRHLARLSTQSQDDYFRILGYKYSDDVLEKQDNFLKRMSGMMRLYAAILVARPPTHLHKTSQHGFCFGWRWLSQTLNLEPVPELTPTLIFDFLEVAGSAMVLHYKGQFWKLLLLLQKEYFVRIKAVSNSDQMGPFNRLDTFIQLILRTRHIPPAKGVLTDSFWRT
uniref:mRNA export factor GLE1 isoform X2 n=1 Tax=Myxine glutinosa TaxID=7769 RepID=UPI00358DDB86